MDFYSLVALALAVVLLVHLALYLLFPEKL
jgi:hypothetical protein